MRLVVEVLAWWVVLAALWTATLSTLAPADLLVGAGASAPAAIVAALARRVAGASWSFDPRWLAWLGALALAVPVDTVRVLAGVAWHPLRYRRLAPALRRVPAPSGEPAHRAAGRRAVAALALSATPASIVVDWPADGSPATVHTVVEGTAGASGTAGTSRRAGTSRTAATSRMEGLVAR